MAATELNVGRRKVRVSNLEKFLHPAAQFTKAQVIAYYTDIAK